MAAIDRWRFIHPFTARFVGPTSCGKTTFLSKILSQKLITPWPTSIIYFYGSSWQSPVFDRMQSEHDITFVPGFNESLIQSRSDASPALIICDDLVLEMKDSETAANLFMRGSHHMNMSVIMIEQSLFPKGRQSVAMKLNTHYTVVFKTPSDALGIATLARQMFPQKGGKFLIDAFHDCTQAPYSYLIIDTKQSTPDEMRLISMVDEPDQSPVVYVNSGLSKTKIQSLHWTLQEANNDINFRKLQQSSNSVSDHSDKQDNVNGSIEKKSKNEDSGEKEEGEQH